VRQPDLKDERKGPKVGAPEAAVQGFLKATGLASLDEAKIQSDRKKGDFYVALIERAGRDTLEVLADFLPVLDDIDRARQHGDLTGGLKAIADRLDAIFGKLGLVAFGEVGDPFDPTIHEAVLHDESADVTEPTCTTVMRPGYKHNDRLLRAAMVGVSDPAVPPPAATTEEPTDDE